MATKNLYGLDLNRGLYFEGRLDPDSTLTLGAYLLSSLADSSFSPLTNVRLKGLEGDIYGIVDGKSNPETKRKLTIAPVIGAFAVTALDSCEINSSPLTARTMLETVDIAGAGILHMSNIQAKKRYQSILPDLEYLSAGLSVYDDDSIIITKDSESGLHFSICFTTTE